MRACVRLSARECAAGAGSAASAVRVRLHRARQALKTVLERQRLVPELSSIAHPDFRDDLECQARELRMIPRKFV